MKKVRKCSKAALLISSVLLSSNIAYANNAEDRYIYIGTELGLSEPVVKEFLDEDTNANFRLKQSRMFGGRVGYSFYPSMMVEVSGTYQPNYGLAFVLPEIETGIVHTLAGAINIPKTPGRTKISAQVYTLNWIYEFSEQFAGIKPYAILGAGFARIHIKPTTVTTNALSMVPSIGNNFEYFKIKKNLINCFVWQAGAGITKDLSENISIDFGAKLQVVNDIKVKYDTYDMQAQSFVPQKPIKKTIGVGEFTLGFTFKLPV
ncbi:MAG: hypothetical protein Tsb006_6550 [Rickettsiaceae bacterium]